MGFFHKVFTAIFHPHMFFSKNNHNISMSFNTVVRGPECFKMENVIIGRDCRLIAHDRQAMIRISNSSIGNGAYISAGGDITIEKAIISPGVLICSYKHGMLPGTWYGDQIDKHYAIKVKEGAWIGQNSILIGNIEVGEWSIIGAGSVVTKNIPPYSIAVGNPARVIKVFDTVTKHWISVNEKE